LSESEIGRRIREATEYLHPQPVRRKDYPTRRAYVAALEDQVSALCERIDQESDRIARYMRDLK